MSDISVLILDRDGLITHNSSDPSSPFYYIEDAQDFVLRPNVKEAFGLIASLAQHHGFKVVLATKQRSLGKGLITLDHLNKMHNQLQKQINFWFDSVYIEADKENKSNLYRQILLDYDVRPAKVFVVDDSRQEIDCAFSLGCVCSRTDDLYSSIKTEFNIN